MQFRQILRKLGKTTQGKIKLREILDRYKHRLTEREIKVLRMTYLEKELKNKICAEMHFCRTSYFSFLNTTLAKLEALLNDTTIREIVQIA